MNEVKLNRANVIVTGSKGVVVGSDGQSSQSTDLTEVRFKIDQSEDVLLGSRSRHLRTKPPVVMAPESAAGATIVFGVVATVLGVLTLVAQFAVPLVTHGAGELFQAATISVAWISFGLGLAAVGLVLILWSKKGSSG